MVDPTLAKVVAAFERALDVDLRSASPDLCEALRAAQLELQQQFVRAAAPALLASLRQTWEVIDAAGISALARGVELGPTVWFVKASDARAISFAAIGHATGIPDEDTERNN